MAHVEKLMADRLLGQLSEKHIRIIQNHCILEYQLISTILQIQLLRGCDVPGATWRVPWKAPPCGFCHGYV